MGRKKTSEQELERESQARFMEQFSDWIVNSHDEEDFGFDFEVRPTGTSEDGHRDVSSQNFYVQLKASEEFEGDNTVSHTFHVDYLVDDCLLTPVPVVLFLYEQESGEFYWKILQEYCWEDLDKNHDGWRNQKYVTVKIERQPMDKMSKYALKRSILEVQERIAYRLRVSSQRNRNSRDIKSIELDFPSEEDIVEYKMDRVETARKLIRAGERSRGFLELYKVHEMPEEDEGKLEAIITLLDKFEIAHPIFAIQQNIYAYEGIDLAEEIGRDGVIPELVHHRIHSKGYIEEFFVGARFLDTRFDEEITVLQVSNWAPGIRPPLWEALLQYETGEFYDENAAAMGLPDYELIELGKGSSPLDDACREDSHDFGNNTIHELDSTKKCSKCGLSCVTLLEVALQDIWRSTGDECAECGCTIPGDTKDEDWEIDIDGRRICIDCWEIYDSDFGVRKEEIGKTFEIFCDECDDWQEGFVPDDNRCPNCGNDHLMIKNV